MTRRAFRAHVEGIDAEAFRDRARSLGVMGWVRPTGEIHAEGLPDALAALGVDGERVKVEGHEQFAIRGVSAGPARITPCTSARRPSDQATSADPSAGASSGSRVNRTSASAPARWNTRSGGAQSTPRSDTVANSLLSTSAG